MGQKIEIVIERERYCTSVKDGAEFTSVSFSGSSYGFSSPCDSPEEVKRAVQVSCSWIRREGDIPIINNTLEKTKLQRWL